MPAAVERLEHAARALDVLARACRATSPWSWNASIGLARHRVDGVGPDQLLDVEHVAVRRGSWSRSTPTGSAARRRPWRRSASQSVAREDLLVGLVGELGVGDRQLALELVVAADLVEALVGLGVDARDEERGDRRHRASGRRRASASRCDAADVGLGDLAVALEREDQRDVDRDAGARSSPRSPAGPPCVAGILMNRFGRSTSACRRLASSIVPCGVVGEVRVDLERDPAVAGVLAGVVPLGAQDVAGAPGCRSTASARKTSFGLGLGLEHLAELLVVGVALGDRAPGRSSGWR